MLIETLAAGAAGLALWSGWIEPRRLVRPRYRTPLPGLARALTAVVIGDLQPNRFHWPAERLREVFAATQAEVDPDLVFWLGDYYNGHTDKTKVILDANPALRDWVDARLPQMEEIAEAMSAIRGRIGTFGVLGNHDWAWSGARTEAAMRAVGIEVLRDVLRVVEEQGNPLLQIAGFDDIASGHAPDFAGVRAQLLAGVPSIALSHTPDAFPLHEDGADLMISGHTHGGQVRLPLIGPILLPVEHHRFDRGWFEEGGRRLFVTSGMGTSLPPLRFLTPPEIVTLDLVPA